MSRKMLALVVVAVMATAAVAYAQRFGGQGRGGGGGRRGGEGAYGYQVRRPDAGSFTGDFTFCRLGYRQSYDYDADGGGWGVDYPRADQNLSIRLS
jgi:opacity protein-like surface antigen